MQKEEPKKELEKANYQVYVVGIAQGTNPNWDKGLWRKFSIFYISDGELKKIWFNDRDKEVPPHWVRLHKTKSGNWVGGYFESRALGMDRVFEIVYSLSQWLFGDGYKLKGTFLNY